MAVAPQISVSCTSNVGICIRTPSRSRLRQANVPVPAGGLHIREPIAEAIDGRLVQKISQQVDCLAAELGGELDAALEV